MNVVASSRNLSERLGACYLSSGVPFGTPLDKYLPCLGLLGDSRSLRISEPLGTSRSSLDLLGASRSFLLVSELLVGHLTSTRLAWNFGASRTHSEPLTQQRDYRLVGHLISTRLARALPPACSACFASCSLYVPHKLQSACAITFRAQPLAEFSPVRRAKRGPPPQAAYRAKRGSRRRRPAPKAPPSLARAANES